MGDVIEVIDGEVNENIEDPSVRRAKELLQRFQAAPARRKKPSAKDFKLAGEKLEKYKRKAEAREKRSEKALAAATKADESEDHAALEAPPLETLPDGVLKDLLAPEGPPLMRHEYHVRCYTTPHPCKKRKTDGAAAESTDYLFEGFTDEELVRGFGFMSEAFDKPDAARLKQLLHDPNMWSCIMDAASPVPAIVLKVLFNMTASPVVAESKTALQLFSSVLGARPRFHPTTDADAVFDLLTAGSRSQQAVSSSHVSASSSRQPSCAWLPAAGDFLAKLRDLGYSEPTVEKLRAVEVFDIASPIHFSPAVRKTPPRRALSDADSSLPNSHAVINLISLFRLITDLKLLPDASSDPTDVKAHEADYEMCGALLCSTLDSRFPVTAMDDLMLAPESLLHHRLKRNEQLRDFMTDEDRRRDAEDGFLRMCTQLCGALCGPSTRSCRNGKDGRLMPLLLAALPDWRARAKDRAVPSEAKLSIELLRSLLSMTGLNLLQQAVVNRGASAQGAASSGASCSKGVPTIERSADCREMLRAVHSCVVCPLQTLKAEWQNAEREAADKTADFQIARQSRVSVVAWQVVAGLHLSEAAVRPLLLSKQMYDRQGHVSLSNAADAPDAAADVAQGTGNTAARLRAEWWKAVKNFSGVNIHCGDAFSPSQVAKSTATKKFDYNQDLLDRYKG